MKNPLIPKYPFFGGNPKPRAMYGTNTNNVHVSVNVFDSSKGEVNYLIDKISTLTSDINSLKADVETLKSIETFEEKLYNYISAEEVEKIKSLINDQPYSVLMNYISQYEEFNNLLNNYSKVKYKETEVYFVEYNEDHETLIKAEVDGEWIILDDVSNSDSDDDTKYKFPVKGFVIGIELYSKEDGNSTEKFDGIKTSYDKETNLTTIYLTEEDYFTIYERRPNNKLKIYSFEIN